jgi:1-acyl-sn-glycerol-3-phosphate acyltransferase
MRARRRLDALLRRLVRLALRLFFREVEVVGVERLPQGRPLILVANHVNGLIDPLLVLGPLPVTPRFLAKSTLWKNPLVRPWLGLLGAIPVFRRQDEEADPAKNLESFERCYELLAASGILVLFPEGVSHNEPQLQPLKTGAARIALEAERRNPGLGLRIVPIGLLFDAKQTFRSRALVQVGEPIDPLEAAREGTGEVEDRSLSGAEGTRPIGSPETVRGLTARIDEALREVTLNYESWEEARLLGRVADLYRLRRPELPTKGSLAEGVGVRRAALATYRQLRARQPERVAAAAAAVGRYDELLRAFRLRDDQVGASYPPSPVVRFVLTSLLRLLVLLPLSAAGTVLNYPVYRLLGFLVDRATRDPDQKATYKVLGALIFFPLSWVGWALLARYALSPGLWRTWVPWLVPVAAPVLGAVALVFHDRRVRFQNEARAFLLLKTRKRLRQELLDRREEVLRWVEELGGGEGSGAGS